VDFKTFFIEQDKDIEIKTICSNEILEKRQDRGYGGMIVQSCYLRIIRLLEFMDILSYRALMLL